MYLTYEQYQEYGGTLDETTFSDYEFEARSQVDWYTFNRLQNEMTYPEAVTRLMYRLIQILTLQAQATGRAELDKSAEISGDNRTIVSQSNDGVSISYNVLPASEIADMCKKDLVNAIQMYLNGLTNSLGRKLLYRGLYPGE